jgi:hypothetical protein
MSDKLERKLQSMPMASLDPQEKQRIHKNLLEIEEKPVKNSRKQLKSVYSTVSGLAVILCFSIFVVFLQQNPFYNQAFIGEKQLAQINELQGIERMIKLPTYAPFEIHEVKFSQTYHEQGPKSIEDGKHKLLEPDNPTYQVQNIVYESSENPYKSMLLVIADSSVGSVYTDGYKRVELDSGINAYYDFNGNSQLLYWREDGLDYRLNVFVQNKNKPSFSDPLPIEEIIKVVESFKAYNR